MSNFTSFIRSVATLVMLVGCATAGATFRALVDTTGRALRRTDLDGQPLAWRVALTNPSRS